MIVAASVAFFPIVINTATGLEAVDARDTVLLRGDLGRAAAMPLVHAVEGQSDLIPGARRGIPPPAVQLSEFPKHCQRKK